MGSHLTASEAKEEHLEKMGDELGSIYHALWQEMAWVHLKWQEYTELFGRKEARIKLLNRSAPTFFRIVQDVLWGDILLHIAKLLDPPKTGNKQNLTLEGLAELIAEPALKIRIADLLSVAREKTLFCRDWRNRAIAHRDLNLALKQDVEPLQPASRASVREALAAVAAILKEVAGHYLKTHLVFDIFPHSGGARELLYVLDDGLRADEERGERIRGGNYTQKDLEARDL